MLPRTETGILWCFAFVLLCSCLQAQISGRVFRDYNANTLQDSTNEFVEPGIANVEVIITGLQGNTTTDLTDQYGFFEIQPLDAPPYRIEFRTGKILDFSGPMSPAHQEQSSAVQFVYSNKAYVQYGINYPLDYCRDPLVMTPCYVMGNPLDPNSEFKDFDAFVSFPFGTGGKTKNDILQSQHGGAAADLISLATAKQVGSCWGVAVQRSTKKIFTSAALKRHSGIGPLSYGGLYEIDALTNTVSPLLDLNSIGVPSGTFISNAQRSLPVVAPPVSADSMAYSFIGKIAYGGMDITEDDKNLYIISLYTRKLYRIFIDQPFVMPTANDIDSFAIPDPVCTNGTFRPWAVRVHRGKVYVGVVCDASSAMGTAADLTATVYEFNPATSVFNTVLSINLDYPAYTNKLNFNPWTDIWNPDCPDAGNIFCQHPQPILADIEFDRDEFMILGLMDRYSMQGGINQRDLNGNGLHTIISFGDILRARYDAQTGMYQLENNANDGVNETAGRNTGFGPGGGEYYFGDFAMSPLGVIAERESLNGALSSCPGYNQVMSSSVDPFGQYSSGVIYLNHSSGNWDKRYNIIPHDFGLFIGKGNALGDLKVFSHAAPLEIGNYVWVDRNNNGLQDPSEPPLPGVTIELIQNNAVIATAVTNVHGQYLFSNQQCPVVNPYPLSFIYEVTGLLPQSNYQLRIPGTANAMVLADHIAGTPNAGTPNNDEIDSDGLPLNPDDIGVDIVTGINGQNDHSFDFGFLPLLPCEISMSDLVVGDCNPLTNGFDLKFKLHLQNGSTGQLKVGLSTGEFKLMDSQANGVIDVYFKNLKTSSLQNVDIIVAYVFDTLCKLELNSAFDQPIPCCASEYELCNNRDALVQLIAVPSMLQYRWFDSTTQTIVGNNPTLLFDKTFFGLQDGYEAYYFVAIDSTGDTIRQHCNYRIRVIDCCGLTVNTFLQTDCNNNGTVNDSTDDWFAVLISADNPQAGPTSRFEVLLNGKLLGTSSYGSSILVGMAPNIDFYADGNSIYKIMVRDADNPICLDSLFTTPSTCPKPKIGVKKTLLSNTIQSDASHNIVYRIEVENTGNESGSYSLHDMPGFDDDIQILTAFYTTNIPGKAGGALLGTGPWPIINNQLIGPGFKHIILLTVNIRINLKANSPGDNIYTSCGANGSVAKSGQGLFNRALLDFDGDGQYDLADTSCADIAYLEIHKKLTNVSQLNLKDYKLNYLITVRNKGGKPGSYNLMDRPSFEDDISIIAGSFGSNVGAMGALSSVVPLDGWLLATNQTIEVSETDSFLITLFVRMDFDPNSFGDNIYRFCGRTNPGQSRIGEGLFNVALLDKNLDLRAEKRDTSCADLPQITHEKILLSQQKFPDESIALNYLLKVKNAGGGSGIYSLVDLPQFEDDVVFQSATLQINNGPSIVLNASPGPNGWTLANNRVLAGLQTDSLMLRIKVLLDYSSNSGGDNFYQPCQKNLAGAYLPGFGLFNETLLDINQDGIADQRDTVCSEYEFYDLALRKYEITATTARNGDYVAFRIAVYNQGSLTAKNIKIVDYKPSTYTIDPILNSHWTIATDSTLYYTIDSLRPKDSVIIDLIIRIHAGFKDINDVINKAEIASFESSNSLPAIDIDSWPDEDKFNDNPVLPEDPNDNLITGHRKINLLDDEDDSDVATVLIFDLALRKQQVGNFAVGFYKNVDFRIWIYNQGNVAAQNISIVDYIPEGYHFNAADNPQWMYIGNNMVTSNIPIIIHPGDSVAKDITLQLLPTLDPQKWVNRAEIKNGFLATVLHILNILQDDFDSYHDMIMDNDPGGRISSPEDDHIDDDGMDSNKDGITDEDDHDPATALVWDLALTKQVKSPKPHLLGQDLEFVITIYNQGTDTVGRVGIRDHIPPGLEPVFHLNHPRWKFDGDHADHIMLRRINPGDTAQVSIFFQMKSVVDKKDLINFAEIVGSLSIDSLDRTGQDFDSREGSDNMAERSVVPGSPQDNNIESNDLGGEEDDHDPASPEVVDLALCKLYLDQLPVKYGDTVHFSISVYNQGTIPIKQFSVVDYLPSGLTWVENPGWIYDINNDLATYTIDTLMMPGDSIKLFIRLKVQNYPGGALDLINVSEIIRVIDYEGVIYNQDIDSKYDLNKLNDTGGIPFSATDNFINDDGFDSDGDGIMDEDDHDPALVVVHDLALRKTLVPVQTLNGDTAIFRITIYNQGNLPVKDVVIADYLNLGYSFTTVNNPGWSLNGSRAEYTYSKILPQGGLDSITIRLPVKPSANASDYYNWSEILSVKDTLGNDISMLDADSTPGSDSPNERSVLPDSPNDNNLLGGGPKVMQDEDDHDVAGYGLRACMGDFIWHDKNGNGRQDNGEEGIKDIVVELYRSPGNIFVKSTKSDNSGKYLFDNLIPGNYYLKFIVPSHYTITSSKVGSTDLDSDVNDANGSGTTATTVLDGGEKDFSWDLGLYKCIPINGFVWYDGNKDGIQSNAENGINGLTVYLYELPSKKLVSTMKTFSNNSRFVHDGYFNFCVKPGQYYIKVSKLSGFLLSPTLQGIDPTRDSDLTQEHGEWTSRSLSGQSCDSLNFIGAGMYNPSLGLVTNTKFLALYMENPEYAVEDVQPRINLRAIESGQMNQLYWDLTDQPCYKFYKIERKIKDSLSYQMLDIIQTDLYAEMNSSCHYQFEDLDIDKPVEYEYRIVALTSNDELVFSNTAAIKRGIKSKFAVYPNPANSTAVIRLGASMEGVVEIKLYDINGREIIVMHHTATKDKNLQEIVLDLNTIPGGLYSISLKADGINERLALTVIK